jgi:hypothetical protein
MGRIACKPDELLLVAYNIGSGPVLLPFQYAHFLPHHQTHLTPYCGQSLNNQTAGQMDGEETNEQVSETWGDCLRAPKDGQIL